MNLLLNYFIESTLAMTLVWLGYKLILEELTFYSWNRFYLISGVVLALILPFISIPLNWTDESIPIQIIETFSTSNLVKVPFYQDSQSAFSVSFLIPLIHFSVSFVLACRLIFSLSTLSKKIKTAQKLNFKGVKLAIDPSFTASSFFEWILISPEEVSSPSIHQIVEHESVHIRSGHTWDLLAFQVLKIVFWTNPVLYLLEKCLKEAHEYQADAKVIEHIPVNEYSRLLVRSISNKMTDFIPSFNQFQTKKRIIMMNKVKSSVGEKAKFLVTVPLVLVMLLLFSFQTQINENKIEGIWIGSEFKFEKTQGPNLEALVEGGRSLHIGGKLSLNENKTYQILDPTGSMNGQGIWDLDGEVLRMTDEGQNVVEYQLVEVDNSTLVTKHEVSMETPMGMVAGTIMLTYSRE